MLFYIRELTVICGVLKDQMFKNGFLVSLIKRELRIILLMCVIDLDTDFYRKSLFLQQS